MYFLKYASYLWEFLQPLFLLKLLVSLQSVKIPIKLILQPSFGKNKTFMYINIYKNNK